MIHLEIVEFFQFMWLQQHKSAALLAQTWLVNHIWLSDVYEFLQGKHFRASRNVSHYDIPCYRYVYFWTTSQTLHTYFHTEPSTVKFCIHVVFSVYSVTYKLELSQCCRSRVWKMGNLHIDSPLYVYTKVLIQSLYVYNTEFQTKLRKINYKNICSAHYGDNTVLVSSDDTSAPTVIENLELHYCTFIHRFCIDLVINNFFKTVNTNLWPAVF